MFSDRNCHKSGSCQRLRPETESLDWRKKYEEALTLLKDAAVRFPDNADMLKYLTELLESQNMYAEAGNYYQKTIESTLQIL